MKAKTRTEIEVHLTLTEPEARWLKAMAQNYMGNGIESEEERKIRESLFHAIEIPEVKRDDSSFPDSLKELLPL